MSASFSSSCSSSVVSGENWYQALCAKQQQMQARPLPTPDTLALRYARRMLDRPRGLVQEGIPVQLQFPLVTDTTVTAWALHRGAPLGTDLVFTRVDPLLDTPLPPGTALLALPGGAGTVHATLGGLVPNSKYRFTLTSSFRYNAAETVRVYRSTDVRNYPLVYTLWTHGPPAVTLTVGRLLRFNRSAVNAVRPGVRDNGDTSAAADLMETVAYFLVMTTPTSTARGDVAVVGPLASTSVYAPPDVPPGTYTAEIQAVYTLNGEQSDMYYSTPVSMAF